jgi:hypothetical protein
MRTFLLVSTVLFSTLDAWAQGPAQFMMLTHVGGEQLEGQPLTWNDEHMALMGRDGKLYEFHPKAAQGSKKTGTHFHGYSVLEMRERLRGEFDKSFDLSHSQHFVVAHPRGEWSVWADRLEALYRSFTHYMSVRGFDVDEPSVPLVAIVFRNKGDYYEHARASGTPLQEGTLGHYDPASNRIFLYDAGLETDEDWTASIDTIIHEATHQTAYNVGIHRRFAEQPRWLVEGLAMMFEAKGLWDAKSSHTRKDRLNRGRLDDFRYMLKGRSANTIPNMIASDKSFKADPAAAYAEAWTLSFFLCETRPREYCDYLAKVGSRKAFSEYSPKKRLQDFARYFGSDFKQLDADLVRFVEDLK